MFCAPGGLLEHTERHASAAAEELSINACCGPLRLCRDPGVDEPADEFTPLGESHRLLRSVSAHSTVSRPVTAHVGESWANPVQATSPCGASSISGNLKLRSMGKLRATRTEKALVTTPNHATRPRAQRGPSMLYAVKQVELAIRHELDAILRESGITAIPYTALTVLERHDGLTASQLSRNSFVTAQTMNEMVIGLEAKGLVRRDPDPDHARRLLVRLTPAGRSIVEAFRPAVDGVEQRMLALLDAHETTVLADLLQRCRHSLHQEPAR